MCRVFLPLEFCRLHIFKTDLYHLQQLCSPDNKISTFFHSHLETELSQIFNDTSLARLSISHGIQEITSRFINPYFLQLALLILSYLLDDKNLSKFSSKYTPPFDKYARSHFLIPVNYLTVLCFASSQNYIFQFYSFPCNYFLTFFHSSYFHSEPPFLRYY